MFTSKELLGLEAELRAVHDNAGAEVARLHRQERIGDWAAVISSVAGEL